MKNSIAMSGLIIMLSFGLANAQSSQAKFNTKKSNQVQVRVEEAKKTVVQYLDAWSLGDWDLLRKTLAKTVVIDETYWQNVTTKKAVVILPNNWKEAVIAKVNYSPFETGEIAYVEMLVNRQGGQPLNFMAILRRGHGDENPWGIVFMNPSPMPEQFALWMQGSQLVPWTAAAQKTEK